MGQTRHHKTEFAVTIRALKDYLPTSPVRILDVGGGPGRYAIALSKLGHQVTLFDLSRRCLEFAKQKAREAGVRLEDYRHGNATNLSFYPNEGFATVLLMGPLYHLFTHEERSLTVKEAKRVLKENGLVFATFITRYAPFRWAAKNDPEWVNRHSRVLETGIFLKDYGPSKASHGFTSAYFAHPSEIKPLMEEAGFKTVDMIGCEGIISMIEEKINEFSGESFQFWVDLNYRLGKDPSLRGGAEHILYIGQRKDKS